MRVGPTLNLAVSPLNVHLENTNTTRKCVCKHYAPNHKIALRTGGNLKLCKSRQTWMESS